jgi:penicillin-binding protein 2
MKSMCSARRISSIFLTLLLFLTVASSDRFAQSRRSKPTAKPSAKKKEKSVKVAKKEVKKDNRSSKKSDSRTAKRTDSRTTKSKTVAKRDQNKKLSAKEKRELAAAEKKNSKKSKAELRRELAERRRAEEARRQAILAEQRRRAEAARQARLRQIAFENGLKAETRENIQNDNTEGEDLQVRAAAVNALGNKAGTVVVMEAQTGKIVTMVNQDWAVKNSFKPCSTIKLVTGVAGLTENVINEEGGIGDSTSGLNLDVAIARSNNGYFQRVGSNIGSGKMVAYAHQLGLGEQTGINAAGETPGRVPNGNNNVRIYSHGDDFEVTPLQLAVMTTAISNGGKRVVPQITSSRTQNISFRPQFRGSVSVPNHDLEEMLPGMIGTAEYGTARRGVDATLGIAGKTGSCIYKGTWIGLFTSVAPVENPKYSVVVITRGSSERGKYAAAIAGRVYQALATRIRPSRDLALAQARFGKRSSIPANNVAAADDEDEEDDAVDGDATQSDVATTVEAPRQDVNTVVPQVRPTPSATPAYKPLVTKTGQSKPKFPPVIIQYDRSGAEQTKTRPRIVENK